MTPIAANEWLASAQPKSRIVYHVGMLMADRQPQGRKSEAEKQARELGEVARAFMDASEKGRVRLVQRRLGDSQYEYIAVRV